MFVKIKLNRPLSSILAKTGGGLQQIQDQFSLKGRGEAGVGTT